MMPPETLVRAMAAATARAAAAARVTALREEAEKVSRQIRVDRNAPVRRYFNGANSLLEQGRQCTAAQDWERAFTLLMRFATYFLEMIPDHPGYKHADMATQRSRLKKECKVRAPLASAPLCLFCLVRCGS